LFYRLNVLPIHCPPLRERRDDIPLLIDHFVAKNNTRLGTSIRGLDTETRRLLYEYAWPVTCASSRTRIERAMVLSEASRSWPRLARAHPRGARPGAGAARQRRAIRQKTTRIIEEILIRRALQKTKGNRTRAAEVLEISHRALLYKIKDYQITDL